MKYVQEYRDGVLAQDYAAAIARITTRPWQIMEICGGQTHAIVKYGIDTLLPSGVTLIHGPGCPVCVTDMGIIDQAIALARFASGRLAPTPQIIFCSFGDMLRVPGTEQDLLLVKAQGGDVRIVYSPLDCLAIAQKERERHVVFFAVGFETTAPATAMAVYQAQQMGITNFSLLVSHVLVPPAMEAILSDPACQIQGFLAAGHVCTIMGYEQYEPIAAKYQIPIVVTGFEPVDILQGLYLCIQQLEKGEFRCENQYARSVQRGGNPTAQEIMSKVFAIAPQQWRGIGEIPASGLKLRPEYSQFDAQVRFSELLSTVSPAVAPTECISGEILRGIKKPHHCAAFGTKCTPERPLGAPMVSSEGACAAYYRYRLGGVERVGSGE